MLQVKFEIVTVPQVELVFQEAVEVAVPDALIYPPTAELYSVY